MAAGDNKNWTKILPTLFSFSFYSCLMLLMEETNLKRLHERLKHAASEDEELQKKTWPANVTEREK